MSEHRQLQVALNPQQPRAGRWPRCGRSRPARVGEAAAVPCDRRRLVEHMAQALLESGCRWLVCISSPSGLDLDLETESDLHSIGMEDGRARAAGIGIALWNAVSVSPASEEYCHRLWALKAARTSLKHVLVVGAKVVEVGTLAI